MALKGKGRN